MSQAKYDHLCKKIIKTNWYMTLATASGSGVPWAAPVYYAVDDQYCFYFISQLKTTHIKHIFASPKVAFAIFDSRQKEGTGNGVQGKGGVQMLKGKNILKAFQWYQSDFVERKIESFSGSSPYRLFKITPSHFYIQDPEAQVDSRIEVFLLK